MRARKQDYCKYCFKRHAENINPAYGNTNYAAAFKAQYIRAEKVVLETPPERNPQLQPALLSHLHQTQPDEVPLLPHAVQQHQAGQHIWEQCEAGSE